MQPGRARTSSLGVLLLRLARWVGWVAPVCPTHGVLVLSCPPAALRVCGVLGHLAPVHRCARSVCCFACAVSWASWLLFTGVPARCVVLRVRCPGPPGYCSPVCPLGVLCWVCGVLGFLAPVHRCARSVCCVACAVSWASWLLFTGVPAPCVVSRVRRPGPPGSCSPVCPLGVLFCVCGVLGLLAPIHRCARSVCCFACAVSWASWLLFTGVPARCVVLGVWCPGPPGSCSPVCPLGALFRVCGVLGHLAPVHRCARSVCCVACAVSWASWLLFTGAPARCVVLRVRCPGPPGSCSLVCPLGVLFCVCGVLGQLAPVHRCACSVCCVGCAVSWASWLLFTGVPARCVVLCVRCPGPPGSCSSGVPAPCVVSRVRRPGPPGCSSPVCRSVCCFACAVSWASWLLFTGVPARCVVLGVWCPGPPGSCSPVCPLGALFRVCGVLGHLAPVHRCARSVCCVGCAVSWASWLLFTGVPARCVVLRVRCPGPPGSCSPVCPLGVLFCVCGVLGQLAPVHRCARSVCCVGCAVSWASRLLFTGVPARCVVLVVRCPGLPGSCSPVCPLRALFRVCGVLGILAPVHRCTRSVCCSACAVFWAPWLLFTGVPARCVVLRVRCPGPPGSCSPVWPLGALFRVCGVLGHLAPVHRCARSVCCFASAVSWASWRLFTGVPARCVVLRVRCPGPTGSCSPVCPLGALCWVCGVLGLLVPVHRCARSVCCVACAVSWASWLLFTGVPARCVVLRVRCPGPPGSCSPVCPLGVSFCVCGVLGHLAPAHRCARSVCCVGCAVSWASWLLFTGVPGRCVVLRVRCPGPPGSCSPVCPLRAFFRVCGVLGHLAPVHRCARSVFCSACAVSWAPWLLFTGVPARCVVLRVRCPGPPGSCSPVCPLGVLCWVCGVLGLLAPVHRCARSVRCFACAASWATWLLFTCAPARCVVLRVRCPGPPGSCSPVCPLGELFCVCGVLDLLAPVHRCARTVCCFACAVSWASWLLFTGVPARCVVLGVRRPGPPGSCSPVCPLGVLFCVCGVLDLLAPVHRCACTVCCFACAVSWANWLLFTGVPARCVVLGVRRPGPPGSCSPVCPLGVLFCVCGVLGLLAPVHRCARSVRCFACAASWASWLLFTGVPLGVLFCVCGVLGPLAPAHRCARSVCCFACAVSWAPWLLFTGVPARCVVLGVRRTGPPGSCSPVCPLGVLFCVCGVLGLLAPVHRYARSVCCFACAVSWANWLLFTGVPARCVVLGVRCPGPPGSCSPVCRLGVLCCVCGFLGLLAPVHRCARSVCCVACAVSWASWLPFTGVPARCVVLRVPCPRPPGSCSPVRPLGVLCCVCGVLGLLAPVHRCARSVCCFACAVSWASWLLFTGAPARCVVLRVRCPGPPGSCSPVCPLGVLCCCAGRRCGALTRPSGRRLSYPAGAGYPPGAHTSIRTAAVRSRQGLGTLRARTRPSGRRLFVAGRGWVPSGRALIHPDGGWRACACSLWPGRAGRPPGRVVVRLTFSFGRFVFLLCLAPSGLGLPPSLSLPLPFLVALALCFGCFSRPPAAWLFVRSRLVCVSRLAVGCSLVVSPPPPSPFVSCGFGRSCLVPWGFFFLFFFFFCAPPLSPAFSGFRPRVPWASALCVVCFVGLPLLGSACACPSFVLSAWLVAAPWWLLPPHLPPPPLCLAVFVAAARCFVPCAVLCCASPVRCCAALLRVVSSGVVLSCAVLRSLGAAACCAVPSGAARRPGALSSAALCFAVFPRAVCFVLCVFCRGAVVRAVVRRSALCCVCPGVLCCAFPVLSPLCGAVLRCAGALALCCSCGACCCWRLVLWCAVVRCWVWWPVVVCWWRVSVSVFLVSLSGRVVCFPVVGVVCCGALLSCVVFCGAVLSRGAVLLCSAVVLRCCWGLLCPPVGCRAVLCCAVGWLCFFLPGGGVCVLWCSFPRAVRSLSSPLCGLRCLVVLAVVPCFPVSCAVALCCRVVLCCRALLSFCGALCVCFALLRPVVRRQCRLRCCWCLVLWRVPVRCAEGAVTKRQKAGMSTHG